MNCDVAIIGGGPAGATVGTLLRKYNQSLRVAVFERSRFPRDHVGESQLPVISSVLDEMGVWGKVEAAGFPIKVGATYRWGRTDDLWDLDFLHGAKFESLARPGKWVGQRKLTAFQVDRARYDKILLDQAQTMGCAVRQETPVRSIRTTGDRVDALVLDDGSEVQARHYVDASGHSGILRRAMQVETDCPTSLQNIAIWDYWRNAEWAVTVGVGGTRIQVLSLPYGWLWFIPLGPDRTSIGLVVPAGYFKETGKRPEEIYLEAVESDPIVARLLRNATREENLSTTKDWSFVSKRLTGENWFLAGESAGFADPILSAGLTLAHFGARDVAYTILAMDRTITRPNGFANSIAPPIEPEIGQHIRFADFWYTGNGVFSDLKDYAREIAADAGLTMSADSAWQWLSQGGFVDRNGGTEVALYGLLFAKEILASFTGDDRSFLITGKTHFLLDLDGAEKDWTAEMSEGRLTRRRMYRRNGKLLPVVGLMEWLVRIFKTERTVEDIGKEAREHVARKGIPDAGLQQFWTDVIKSLEALVSDGWIVARIEPGAPPMPAPSVDFSPVVRPNVDIAP